MKNDVSKRIDFGPSKMNKNVYVPSKWFLDDVEVTEMEYYGITPTTTLEELGGEPFDQNEMMDWDRKKDLINQRDGKMLFGDWLL